MPQPYAFGEISAFGQSYVQFGAISLPKVLNRSKFHLNPIYLPTRPAPRGVSLTAIGWVVWGRQAIGGKPVTAQHFRSAFSFGNGDPSVAAAMRDQAYRLAAMAGDLLAFADTIDEALIDDPEPASEIDRARLAEIARDAYRGRRVRDRFFDDAALFGEPAWDMLIDLFIAACDGKKVPVTSACIGASVPTTTALRWLAVLETRGLVVREADLVDARRVFVRLSDDANAKMKRYFTRIAQDRRGETIDFLRAGRSASHFPVTNADAALITNGQADSRRKAPAPA